MWRIKRIFSIFILFILISTVYSQCFIANGNEIFNDSAEQYGRAYRYNDKAWIYLHIEGDAYERGFQHGYLLSEEIVDMLNRWSNTIHNHETIKRLSKRASEKRYNDISETWWNFCRRQCDRLYSDKFPNEYKEEITGIADGINSKGGKIHGRAIDTLDIVTLNQMYEYMSKLTNKGKRIHPLRTLFHNIRQVLPLTSKSSFFDFLNNFYAGEPAHHCNGFAATGDATTEGQIVFSHSTICGGGTWWWNYYISLRWNIILDIQPTNGNRIIMSSSPGLIWSDEDYYQNDNGILLLETTNPQGLYDNIGLPLSVRARNAMQYGNSIDDVIYHLRYKNDGSMNAVWLIGDTKTGEIARMDLGYNAYKVYRTKNGFYWSANNPFDIKLRLEKFIFNLDYIISLINWIFNKNRVFAYYSIRYIAGNRDVEYERLGNEFYGEIDIDILKHIMSIKSISYAITDIKLTDTALLEKNGLWAFFGNPLKTLKYSSFDNQDHESYVVKPSGWIEIFGIKQKEGFELKREPNLEYKSTDVVWDFDTGFNVNDFTSNIVIHNEILYTTTSEGKIFAIDIETKKNLWNHFIGENPIKPVIKENHIFIGHSEGLTVLDLDGFSKWDFLTDDVLSPPIIIDKKVIFGTNVGTLYCLSYENGNVEWTFKLDGKIYISPSFDENLYVAADDICYGISLKDKLIKWTYSSNGPIRTEPILADGAVFFGSSDNYVYSLDSEKGIEKWKFQTGWQIDASPAIFRDLIFVASNDNNVYALDKENGILKWIFSCNSAIHTKPVVYGDYVFIGSDDGRIYAVDKINGEYIWSFAPEDKIDFDLLNYITTPIVSQPFLDKGIVYIGVNGTIYGLDAQTTEEITDISDKHTDIPIETWIFIIISLLFVITLTVIYLYTSKKRFK
jgi:outer membrane protein assembly factor BamB